MARLVFGEDDATVRGTVGTAVLSVAGLTATLYLDAAANTLAADLQTYPGAVAITDGHVTVDDTSRLPLFYGPASGADTLYAVINDGPATAIYARADDRLDAIVTALATKVDTAGAGLVKSSTTLRRAASTTGYATFLDLPTGASHTGEMARTGAGGVYEYDGSAWQAIRSALGIFNVKDYGAKADGVTNDTAAIVAANAAASAAGGGTVYYPAGTYIVTPDPATGVAIPLLSNVSHVGAGVTRTVIKTAASVGDHVGVFGALNQLVRTDNIEFRGLTFDTNYTSNQIANEDHLNVYFGSSIWDASVAYLTGAYVLLPGTSSTYQALAPNTNVTPGTDGTKWALATPPNAFRQRRNPIVTILGDRLSVVDCRFLNSPRQSVFFGGKAPGDITNARVLSCDFITTVDATHDATHDWDTTAVFIRGDDCLVGWCLFQGFGTAFFISRLGVQISGARAHVLFNKFDKYYRLIIVGNSGYSGIAEDIVVIGNVGTNCNGGVELQSDSWTGWVSGPGVRGVLIATNVIRTNMPAYQRANGEAATPYGIKLSTDSDLPWEIVSVDGNEIYHELAYTAGGSRGIAFAVALDPEDPSTSVSGTCRGLSITNNNVWNAGINAIAAKNAPNGIEVVTVTNNTIVNCGNRSGITTQQAAAVRIEGVATGLTVSDNAVFDFRTARLITYALYINCTALVGARYTQGNRWAADGTDIPPLFTNNSTSLVLVDDSHPLSVAVSASKTLLLSDDNTVQEASSASAIVFTIPPAMTGTAAAYNAGTAYTSGQFVSYSGAFYKAVASSTGVTPGTDATKWVVAVQWPSNAFVRIYRVGTGDVSVAAGTGVTLRAPDGAKIAAQYKNAGVRYRGAAAVDTWVLEGALIP